MSELFEATNINGMIIKNRFVRSATWEGMAEDDGMCTGKLINLMCKLAKGEVGLIITGHAYVHKKGKAGPWQLGIYEDRLIPFNAGICIHAGMCELHCDTGDNAAGHTGRN